MSSMNEIFPILIDFQVVLAKKFQIEKEISMLPEQLEVRKTSFAIEDAKLKLQESELEELNREIKSLRIRLDDAQRQHEKYQMQASEVHNAREFELLNKEIDEAQRVEVEIRNSLKQKEKEFKELDILAEELRESLNTLSAELNKEEEELNSLIQEKNKELEELVKEEQKFTPKLDISQLTKFERIIKNKDGVGIVSVKGVVCQGCHMVLPRQFVNDIRSNESLNYCPFCSRILYYEEGFEEQEEEQEIEEKIELVKDDEDFLI